MPFPSPTGPASQRVPYAFKLHYISSAFLPGNGPCSGLGASSWAAPLLSFLHSEELLVFSSSPPAPFLLRAVLMRAWTLQEPLVLGRAQDVWRRVNISSAPALCQAFQHVAWLQLAPHPQGGTWEWAVPGKGGTTQSHSTQGAIGKAAAGHCPTQEFHQLHR